MAVQTIKALFMNAGEKLSLKHSLILAGFWDDEESDPATEENATAALLLKIEKRLGQGAYLFFPPASASSTQHEVRVNWPEMTSVLARDEELPVALCLAALELPNFLERHPECAAAVENDKDEEEMASDSLPGLPERWDGEDKAEVLSAVVSNQH